VPSPTSTKERNPFSDISNASSAPTAPSSSSVPKKRRAPTGPPPPSSKRQRPSSAAAQAAQNAATLNQAALRITEHIGELLMARRAASTVPATPLPASSSLQAALQRAQRIDTWMTPVQMRDFANVMKVKENVDTYLAIDEENHEFRQLWIEDEIEIVGLQRSRRRAETEADAHSIA
jgi:hypothetical protein